MLSNRLVPPLQNKAQGRDYESPLNTHISPSMGHSLCSEDMALTANLSCQHAWDLN